MMHSTFLKARAFASRQLSRFRPYLPLYFKSGPEIAHLYINDGPIRTAFTFTNFVSLYAPDSGLECAYDLTLYGRDGVVVDRARINLAPYGSLAVRPEDVFKGEMPTMGMLSARISVGSPTNFAARHLGDLVSSFYATYSEPESGSIAVIHSLNKLDLPAAPDIEWTSQMVIRPAQLEALEIYQINPSRESAPSTLFLYDDQMNILASSGGTVPAHGTRRILMDVSEFKQIPHLRIGAHGLTARNAKPTVLCRFADGSFAGSHS